VYPGTFADLTPDKPAVIMSDTGASMSYAELDERSTRLADVLHRAGLVPGDDVALLAENSLRTFEVIWAALRSGLYVTAINHHLLPDEVAYILDDCDAKALVVSYDKGSISEAAPAPGVALRLAFGGPVPGHEDYEGALTAASSVRPTDQPRGQDMLYSSGTTGRPKGVRAPLPDGQVDRTPDPLLTVFGKRYGFEQDMVYLTPAPLYHAAPLRFATMTHSVGGTVVVMPRFDATAALESIERYRVTHSQWVPTMFVRMLKLPEEQRAAHDLSSHRVAVHAAAPCPEAVKREMIAWWGPILHEYYGSTETLGLTLIDSDTWARKPGSVGTAALGTVRICGEDGEELPIGHTGLIYFEREVFPFAYHKDPQKTREAQHPQHPTWGTTGDVGHLDDDGFLYLTDRRAFVIISGGVNIYPQEIEDAVVLHPAVRDVAVIGVPDAEMGQQVRAVVQVADGVQPGPELERQLLTFLGERLARFKVPRHVDFVDALPRTETGKLQKRLLVEAYASGREG
jgi:long-chain acyl-CoA synthetase